MADDLTHQPDYLAPYHAALTAHGPGFKATLWGTEDAQRVRFDVMQNLVDFTGTRILDAGCGRGDFAARLIALNVTFDAYLGIDALGDMVRNAAQRKLPQCTFEAADFAADPSVLHRDPPVDYVCFSGTLNTMNDQTARTLVRAAYDAAAQGVVFNFLSNRAHPRWADRDLTPARRFDTIAWLDWSLELSSRVSFTQEYLDGHDATILIRHD